MDSGFLNGLEVFFLTVNQILTAGIAITAFSLLLYVLTFNFRDKVVRTFLAILACVVVVFTSEAIGSTPTEGREIEIWLRIQWVGIIFLPSTYFHFSDALLATTGKPSRGRRRLVVFFSYCMAIAFVVILPFSTTYANVILEQNPAPYLSSYPFAWIFLGYYLLIMVLAWYNFIRAYRRTTTSNSRRRMLYLTTGALAPAIGSFPYLLFGAGFASQHQIIFWIVSCIVNGVLGVLMVVMAYSVGFFGVSWPDRVIKTRLLKWLLRGPFTASVTLGVVTIVRRIGAATGIEYSAWVPILMVSVILLCEYLITILAPIGERIFLVKDDRENLELLRTLENRMLTENDLKQFLEMVASAVCDRLQAGQASIWAVDAEGYEIVVSTGRVNTPVLEITDEVISKIENVEDYGLVEIRGTHLMTLRSGSKEILGVLGISSLRNDQLDREQLQALKLLAQRATLALRDRFSQNQILTSLQALTPQVELLQRMRAAASYNENNLFREEDFPPDEELVQWVRDALGHYWGGPKLTDSPLLNFRIVERTAQGLDGNQSNALRAVLKDAIEQVRPAGERKFTSEWILYNILEMKYMEGRKMREIASRLSLSEADLYRKQRVAIEAAARAIMDMEDQARKQNGNH
jgi:hypothetical protein